MMNRPLLVLAAVFVVAAAQSFPSNLNGDPNRVSVSGLSSGAFAAVQFHFSFADELVGAGIVAGGPWFCARGSETDAFECMDEPLLVSLTELEAAVAAAFAAGELANPASLAKGRTFLFSGTKDTVVNPGTMAKLQQMYAKYMPASQIQAVFNVPAEHGMIIGGSAVTSWSGANACATLGSPYIQSCQMDAAGKILQWIYGAANVSAPVAAVADNLYAFSQAAFVPNGQSTSSVSMGPTGYVYVPTVCKSSNETEAALCPVHIALHGCEQSIANIGTAFVQHTAYVNYAESSGIIVIFPQAESEEIKNPDACFDWWGFTGSDYATRNGAQNLMFAAMARAATNGQAFPSLKTI